MWSRASSTSTSSIGSPRRTRAARRRGRRCCRGGALGSAGALARPGADGLSLRGCSRKPRSGCSRKLEPRRLLTGSMRAHARPGGRGAARARGVDPRTSVGAAARQYAGALPLDVRPTPPSHKKRGGCSPTSSGSSRARRCTARAEILARFTIATAGRERRARPVGCCRRDAATGSAKHAHVTRRARAIDRPALERSRPRHRATLPLAASSSLRQAERAALIASSGSAIRKVARHAIADLDELRPDR